MAEFDGNPKTTVIVVYAPTNCASEEIVEEFYEDLRNSISDVPAHNFLIVVEISMPDLGLMRHHTLFMTRPIEMENTWQNF